MKVVMDTSSLISLQLIDILGKSLQLIDIIIPETVKNEIEEIAKYKDKKGLAAKKILHLIKRNKIKVYKIRKKIDVKKILSRNVNMGEAECFVCCLEKKIPKLIMDDIDAAYRLEGLAFTKGIDLRISVAILVEMYLQKMINKSELQRFIKKLIKIRGWEAGILEVLSKKYLKNF